MKIEAIVKYIVVSFLLFANLSCKENKDETLIAKVTDLTEEEEVISDIEYDGDGRIIRYGDTPIVYAGDKVTIGKMDCLHSGNKLCSVTFKMAKGKAIESRTRCLLKRGSETWDVFKTSTYEYGADTLCIKSDYFGVEGNDFLKRVCTKYIFGDDGKLMESITMQSPNKGIFFLCFSGRFSSSYGLAINSFAFSLNCFISIYSLPHISWSSLFRRTWSTLRSFFKILSSF